MYICALAPKDTGNHEYPSMVTHTMAKKVYTHAITLYRYMSADIMIINETIKLIIICRYDKIETISLSCHRSHSLNYYKTLGAKQQTVQT